MRKKPKKLPREFEDGRARTKRLKLQAERRRIRKENETPQQREARLQKIRDRRKNRQGRLAAMTADRFVEEISKVKPVREKPKDLGDHPAISFQRLIKEEVDCFEMPPGIESESESSEEEVSLDQDHYKLNKFKIKCFEMQRDLDMTQAALQYENRRKLKMEEEMFHLRRKANELEDLYGIPVI